MKRLNLFFQQRNIACSVPLLSLIVSVFLVLSANLSFWKAVGNDLPFPALPFLYMRVFWELWSAHTCWFSIS